MGHLRFSAVRRRLLAGSGLGAVLGSLLPVAARGGSGSGSEMAPGQPDHAGMSTVGRVDPQFNGFDPHDILTDWNPGKVSRTADGQRLREYDIVAVDKEIEVAPGIRFAAWTYNGRVPGPTLRVTEGDRVRVKFSNAGSHPHTIHFHGIHSARMDGIAGAGEVGPGESFTYEFDAFPFGCHFYHCHSVPLKRHIHKGLYGAFIVDPDPERHPEQAAVARSRLLGTRENSDWQELLLVMNGFDTNFDGDNEIYAVNTVAHAYSKRPIRVERKRPIRLYLINATEFDPVNSLHVHANFFDYYDHGTTLEPTLRTIDTVMQCQAQRGILELSFADHEPGLYMFHAHQSEFVELGWMSFFEVLP